MTSQDSKVTITAQAPRNWSIYSIPAAYGLALIPHYYFFGRAMLASKFAYSNALPRANLETLKNKLPEATWKSLVRARGAHLNGLESFPIFASAILAGNYAKLPDKDLNSAAGQYLTARVIYTGLYMIHTSEALSYVRSGVYAWSLAIPIWILWKAGTKLRDEGVNAKTL